MRLRVLGIFKFIQFDPSNSCFLNFSVLSCFYVLHPAQVFFSPLLSILSLLLCSGLTSLSLTDSSLLQVCALLAFFFSPLHCVSSPLVPSLLCCAVTYAALPSSTLPYPPQLCFTLAYSSVLQCNFTFFALPSPTLLCSYSTFTNSLCSSPTLPYSYYFSTLLCANLVLSCILTYPTLLLVILCNHLTWLATFYWCTQAQHRALCMIHAQGKVRFLCQSMGKNIQRHRIGTL